MENFTSPHIDASQLNFGARSPNARSPKTTSGAIAATSSPSIVPSTHDGRPAVGQAPEDAGSSPISRLASAGKLTRDIAFKLDEDPREKGFMHEFCRGGLAQTVFGKKTAFWSCHGRVPSEEEKIADAKQMAKQFGIDDYRKCTPLYPTTATEAVEVLEHAARCEGLTLAQDEWAVIYTRDEVRGSTHFCLIFKPLLAQEIRKSPKWFGLPPNPTDDDVRRKVEYLSDPDNFFEIRTDQMFSRMLFEDEHSIRRYHETEKIPLDERARMEHPVTREIGQMIASVRPDERLQTVVPVGMVYFNGGGDPTETSARNNIEGTAAINEHLQEALAKARETNPAQSFSNVAFAETLRRLYR